MSFISIIAPVYNEEAVIAEFIERMMAVITPLESEHEFEVILVDDGSRDRSLELMKTLARNDKRLRVIELRRNYGQTPALQAGLDAAKGEIVISLDADLQHFPEEIPQFLNKLAEGYDVVCGWRHQRNEGMIRRYPSRAANYLIRRISGLTIHDIGTTFRAYRAEFVSELRLLGEFHRFLPVLITHIGGRITEIPVQNIERPAGKSNYGIGRTFGVLLDLVLLQFLLHYFDRPLRLFGKIATPLLMLGIGIIGVLVVYAYLTGIQAVLEHIGWFIFSLIFILIAVQILLTGILAEVMIRVFYAHDDQRVYRIRHEWNAQLFEAEKITQKG